MSSQRENQYLRQRVAELELQLQHLKTSLNQQQPKPFQAQPTKSVESLARRTSQAISKDVHQIQSNPQPVATYDLKPRVMGTSIGLANRKEAASFKVLQQPRNLPFHLGFHDIELQDSAALFQAYVETANDIVYTLDLTGAFTFINSYGQKLFGCTATEVIGQSYLDFVAPSSQAKVAQAFRNLLQTGELRDFEFLLRPRVGPEVCLEANGRLLYCNGDLIGAIGIARDITERKRFEQQLQMFLKAVESVYDSAVITDLDGWILYANPSASRVFSCTADALSGQNSSMFYLETEQSKWLTQQAIAGGWSGEIICQRQRSSSPGSRWYEHFPALVSVGPIYDEQGNATAVSVICRDITDQKQAQAKLAAKNLELERVNCLKSEFLANMSHELRTPLTSILGFSSLIKKQVFGTLNPKQLDYVNHIHESGNHLLSLINNVLDLSKVETEQISLNIKPVLVRDLCQSVLALVSEQAGVRGLLVRQAIQSNLAPLKGDELRIKQMLLNLLSNAIKFSQAGGEIGLDAKTQAGYLLLTVWDQGIGIPEEKYHLLFQPFQQLESSLDRRYGGTGLGLALTRQMAELHGGTVEFESKVGQGSCFTIRLPLSLSCDLAENQLGSTKAEFQSQNLSQSEVRGQAALMDHTGHEQVLVVDDHSSKALFLQDILQH